MDLPQSPDAPCSEGGGAETRLPEQRAAAVSRIEFVGGQRLLIERSENEGMLTLTAPSGEVTFSVRITPSGPVLRFEHGLRIEAAGSLTLSGRNLAFCGEESVMIRSGGNAAIDAAGDLSITAQAQHIKARLGNVEVKANDDVRLTGERVRLNC